MIDRLQSFFISQSEPNKSCFLALREIILKYDSQISETIKYGMPCYLYAGKPTLYLWKDKQSNYPYILFVDGNQLDHSALIQGDRAKMKILSIDPTQDIPVKLIHEILSLAVGFRQKST